MEFLAQNMIALKITLSKHIITFIIMYEIKSKGIQNRNNRHRNNYTSVLVL